MGRLVLMLMVWLLQASLIVLLANAEWLERQVIEEQASIIQHFGKVRSSQLLDEARTAYDNLVVRTGVRQKTYSQLLPDPAHPTQGLENLAPWFFTWLRQRLDAFWSLVLLAMVRGYLFREWGGLTLIAATAALVDGMMQRRINRSNHALASADKYLAAKFALFSLLLCALTYLSAPVAITPMFVPAWAACLSLASIFLTAHAQHRI